MKDEITITIDSITATCIVANIQLATRHEKNIGPSRKIAENFAIKLQERIIEINPMWKDVLEKGWDPNYDVAD